MSKYTTLNDLFDHHVRQAASEANISFDDGKELNYDEYFRILNRISHPVTRRLIQLENGHEKLWRPESLVHELTVGLNDYQIESVVDALNDSQKWRLIYQKELEKFNQGVCDLERNPLIDAIIIPFNVQRLTSGITDRIVDDKWTVMYVGAGDDEPAFAYTIGLVNLIGKELMVSGIPYKTAGIILNSVAQQLIDGVDINQLDIMVTPKEHRIVHVSLKQACEEMPLTIKHYCRVKEEDQLMVIVLADKNGLLPGDEGYDETFDQYYMDRSFTVKVTEPTDEEKQVGMSPKVTITFGGNKNDLS